MNVSRFVTQPGYSTLGAVLFLITMATRPAAAQAVTPVSTSQNPSWDQQLRCDTDAHCSRFTVLEKFDGGAVLDRETGLVWEQSPSTAVMVWGKAALRCNQLVTAGRGGWRLPTLQELGALVDLSVAGGQSPRRASIRQHPAILVLVGDDGRRRARGRVVRTIRQPDRLLE